MSFYVDHVYPYFVSILGNPKPIRRVRQQIIPLAQGMVLEIGAGSGANFTLYDAGNVSKLYALEPNPGMIRLAEKQRQRTRLNVEYLGLRSEHIPLADSTIDTVVSTFTLCTIADVRDATREIARVLRPEGSLIFFELMRAPDPDVQRWQQRWEPLQYRLYAGLYLTRDIPTLLGEGGFQIEQITAAYLTRFPKSWAYTCWGTAIRLPHA